MALHVPAGQDRHLFVLVEPVSLLYVPAAHNWHAELSAIPVKGLKVPSGQTWQASDVLDPAGVDSLKIDLNWPGGHFEQLA